MTEKITTTECSLCGNRRIPVVHYWDFTICYRCEDKYIRDWIKELSSRKRIKREAEKMQLSLFPDDHS